MAPRATGKAHARAGFPGLLGTWHRLLPAGLCPPAPRPDPCPRWPCSQLAAPSRGPAGVRPAPGNPAAAIAPGAWSLVPGADSPPPAMWTVPQHSAPALAPTSAGALPGPPGSAGLLSSPSTELARDGALGAAFPEASPPGPVPRASVLTTCVHLPSWPWPRGSPLPSAAQAWSLAGTLHTGEARAGGEPRPQGPPGGLAPTCPAPWPWAGGSLRPRPAWPSRPRPQPARNHRENACLCQWCRKQSSLWFVTQIFCLFFSEHNKAQDKSLPRPPPPRQTEMICLHWRRRGWPAAPRAVPSLWAWPRGSKEGARAGLGAAPAAALRAGRALGSERAGGFCPAGAGGVAPPAAPLQGTPPSALSPTAPPPHATLQPQDPGLSTCTTPQSHGPRS